MAAVDIDDIDCLTTGSHLEEDYAPEKCSLIVGLYPTGGQVVLQSGKASSYLVEYIVLDKARS